MKLLLDENNKIVDIADQESEVHSSLTWVDVADGTEVYTGDTYDNGSVTPAQVTAPTFEQQRRMEYPAIGDQLDMLYHDIKAGTLETGDWISAIESVKEANPKPE